MGAALLALLLTVAGVTVLEKIAIAQGGAPALRVAPFFPQPLPLYQVLGSVTGVAVDAQDHVWVVHRGADSLEPAEKGVTLSPPTSGTCCVAAAPVLEFDTAGKLLSSFGGPGQGYQWPQAVGGIAVDAKGNVWIAAMGLEPAPPPPPGARGRGRGAAPPVGPPDGHVLKFSRTGQFLLQIGTPGKMEGPDSQTTLNRPAAVAVDSAANEVYVADRGNHRIVVFDADKGTYKRQWGGSGEKPTAEGGGPYDPSAPPARQFRDVSCVKIAKDGMVYVCDRTSDRIQVFQKDGKFVKEGIVSKNTTGQTVAGTFGVLNAAGSVWDLTFSSDPQQRFLYVADGVDMKVLILNRNTLAQVGTLGSGGRYPGQFLVVSTVAMDSHGNLYTGEQHHGKRVQKFSTTGK
jgi:DNA-binding beta-propeller fold protein YncE